MGGFQWDRRQQYGLKNQYGWLCLCTKVAIGVYLTKWWKIFCCGVKIEHCYKDIGIREYSEKLSHYCFQNAFSTATGTLANNLPLFDDVDDKELVGYFHCTGFSTSLSSDAHDIPTSEPSRPSYFQQPLLCLTSLFVHSILFRDLKTNRGVGGLKVSERFL